MLVMDVANYQQLQVSAIMDPSLKDKHESNLYGA